MQEVECLYYLLSEGPPTAASGGYLHNFPKLYPRPGSLIATHELPCHHSRASPSPSPHSAKIKEQKGNERTEGRKQSGRPTPEPATPPSPRPPPVQARPPFPSPYPLCLAPGRSEAGRPAAEGAPRCLHEVREDLHHFAACRASRSSGQTLACAKWEPRQSPHLAVTWSHVWPSLRAPRLGTCGWPFCAPLYTTHAWAWRSTWPLSGLTRCSGHRKRQAGSLRGPRRRVSSQGAVDRSSEDD